MLDRRDMNRTTHNPLWKSQLAAATTLVFGDVRDHHGDMAGEVAAILAAPAESE